MSNRNVTVNDQHRPEPRSRLLNVDALRGFALLGILAVNIWVFADPYHFTAQSNPAYNSGLDHAVLFVIKLLCETKFYLLFSFLFGYSFTLQMDAAARAKASFLPRMGRRQAGLLVLGLLHGILLFYGEILFIYALLGLVLMACRGFSPGRAVKIGVGLVILTSAMWMLAGVATWFESTPPEQAAPIVNAMLTALGGDASSTLAYHAAHWFETCAVLGFIQGPSALAMFFLGFAAGRVRLFEHPERYQARLRQILWIGFPLGLIGSLVYALAGSYSPGGSLDIIAYGCGALTAPLLTASYVAAGLMLFQTGRGQRIERALAPMGKMALTNYIGQSLALGILFTGYGFRLIDRLSPLAIVAVVLVIFAFQMLLSRWWLKRHLYGPGEWVLRAVTIAGIPPWWRDQQTKPSEDLPSGDAGPVRADLVEDAARSTVAQAELDSR